MFERGKKIIKAIGDGGPYSSMPLSQEAKFTAIKALQNDYYFSSDSEGDDIGYENGR